MAKAQGGTPPSSLALKAINISPKTSGNAGNYVNIFVFKNSKNH